MITLLDIIDKILIIIGKLIIKFNQQFDLIKQL
jgi:hypothetical protein